MRHRKKLNHLGRKSQHRQAMLSNMAASLILHKRIFTTIAKAKALKVYVEPLITKCKVDSTNSRRVVFSYLSNKIAVSELFREISQKVADRPGGYTRILKTGFRQGDGAEMCMIELVDYNPTFTSKASENQGKKTRRAGRRKKAEPLAAAAIASVVKEKDSKEAIVEDVVQEEIALSEEPVLVEGNLEEVAAEATQETEVSIADAQEDAQSSDEEVTTDEATEEEKK